MSLCRHVQQRQGRPAKALPCRAWVMGHTEHLHQTACQAVAQSGDRESIPPDPGHLIMSKFNSPHGPVLQELAECVGKIRGAASILTSESGT